jgi:predicted transcriptional regulator
MLEVWDEDPKPAYNTVSTIVRILHEKEFVDFRAYGRTHEYFPKVSEVEYRKDFMIKALEHVFSGSVTSLVSTLVDTKQISDGEIEELKKLIDTH